jgi:two-component sensor histidine kinase
MLLILLPMALITIILATTTYRSVRLGIERSQIETTSNFAVRVRFWFRGFLRTSVATQATAEALINDPDTCMLAIRRLLENTDGLHAVQLRLPGGMICSASSGDTFSSAVLADLMSEQQAKRATLPWAGTPDGFTRYDAITLEGQNYLLIYHRRDKGGGETSASLVLIDPKLLDLALELGNFERGGIVALVRRGQQILVARGIDENERGWLPRTEAFPSVLTRADVPDVSGTSYVYAAVPIAEPDIYLLARFDNQSAQAAFTQFAVLCATPLLMLAVLFAAYVWAIDVNVLRWLKAISLAARARQEGRSHLVAFDPAMPEDITMVASSFNELVQDADRREGALRNALDDNNYLMRELHHRVKNSLQVIQSYLALSRRQHKRENDRHLIETEAKVQVLSIAYRLALLEGTMRPVPLRTFAEEILGNLSTSLRLPHQWIEFRIQADVGLVVDRTIPLGLALVESVAAGLSADDSKTVAVAIQIGDDARVSILVMSDGVLQKNYPPPKIMSGLAAQIEARVGDTSPGVILNWTFVP